MHQIQPAPRPVEAQYLPPGQRPDSSGTWKGIGAGGIGIGVLFLKFKTFLFFALGWLKFAFLGKILLSSFSFLASVWVYALFWGWQFGLVFALLILIHELGHAAFMKFYGVPASLPYFIPGMGALITMKGRPASALHEAYIALGGPLFGTLGALACYAYGEATGTSFWIAAAYTGFLLNLFNLFPVMPLDGGRVVGAVSPRVWIFGLVAMIVAAVAFRWWNPLMIILVLASIPQAIAAWRGQLDSAYHDLAPIQRGGVALAYFALAAFLFVAMQASHIAVPAA